LNNWFVAARHWSPQWGCPRENCLVLLQHSKQLHGHRGTVSLHMAVHKPRWFTTY
jgi:hypothetical protein